MCGLAGRAIPATSMRRRRITRTPRSLSAPPRALVKSGCASSPAASREPSQVAERVARRRGHRHHALLAALAAHAQLVAVGVPVAHAQSSRARPRAGRCRRAARTARGRAAASSGARRGSSVSTELLAVLGGERRGQAPLALRPGQTLGGIRLARAALHAEAEERAQRGEPAVAGRRPCAAVEARQVGAHRERLDPVEPAAARALGALGQPARLAEVRAQRVRREAALGGEEALEGGERARVGRAHCRAARAARSTAPGPRARAPTAARGARSRFARASASGGNSPKFTFIGWKWRGFGLAQVAEQRARAPSSPAAAAPRAPAAFAATNTPASRPSAADST